MTPFRFARKRNAAPNFAVVLPHNKGLRVVAMFEALKGAVVLIAGFGLLSFLGRDAEDLAEQLVLRAHLNPAHHYPQIFIQAMASVTDSRLRFLAGLAALYSLVRFVEAYGLWRQRRWAEWLAAFSGGIYVPVELYEVLFHFSWLKLVTLTLNLAIVWYMIALLTENLRHQRAKEAGQNI